MRIAPLLLTIALQAALSGNARKQERGTGKSPSSHDDDGDDDDDGDGDSQGDSTRSG